MSPDDRALIPMPACCQTCSHRVSYLRSNGDHMVERHECNHPFGVLPHPNCSWRVPRVISLAADDRPKRNEETRT